MIGQSGIAGLRRYRAQKLQELAELRNTAFATIHEAMGRVDCSHLNIEFPSITDAGSRAAGSWVNHFGTTRATNIRIAS